MGKLDREYAAPNVAEAGDIRDLTAGSDNKFSENRGMGPQQRRPDERVGDTPVDLPARDAD